MGRWWSPASAAVEPRSVQLLLLGVALVAASFYAGTLFGSSASPALVLPTSRPQSPDSSISKGVTQERFEKNNQFWKSQVHKYWSFIGAEKTNIRNVMDMNANYGGFAAALSNDSVWIMNIVPYTVSNTLPVIYDRGLLGSYHDWLV
nr:unnamed protein product [Digitaria exilis]